MLDASSYFSFLPVLHDLCNVLSCLLDDAYKRTLAANRKEYSMWRQLVFSLAICVVLYRKFNVLSASLKITFSSFLHYIGLAHQNWLSNFHQTPNFAINTKYFLTKPSNSSVIILTNIIWYSYVQNHYKSSLLFDIYVSGL